MAGAPVSLPPRPAPTPYERVRRARAQWRRAIEHGSLRAEDRRAADEVHDVAGVFVHLDPVLVPRERFDADRRVAERVARSIHRTVCALADDPEAASDLLGGPIQRTDAPLYLRLDATPTRSVPAVFALHCGAVGGFHTQDLVNAAVLASRPDGLPGVREELLAPVLEAVASRHRMRSGRDTAPNTMILLGGSSTDPGRTGGSVPPVAARFARVLRDAGWPARVGTTADLARRGGRLELVDERWPVEAVFQLARADEPGIETVREAELEGLIVHVNPPHPHGARAILELIDDVAVPWTRVVADRTTSDPDGEERPLRELLLGDRGRFVLKPSEGFGAARMLIGREASPARWRATIDGLVARHAEGERWVAQEWRELPAQTFHSLDAVPVARRVSHDLNLFLVDGTFAGYSSRWFAPSTPDRRLSTGVAAVLVV